MENITTLQQCKVAIISTIARFSLKSLFFTLSADLFFDVSTVGYCARKVPQIINQLLFFKYLFT